MPLLVNNKATKGALANEASVGVMMHSHVYHAIGFKVNAMQPLTSRHKADAQCMTRP